MGLGGWPPPPPAGLYRGPGGLSGPSPAHLGPSGKGVCSPLNTQEAPQPFLRKSPNHSMFSQTKLRAMAKNLRVPLGHGGPSVNQVSATPAPGKRVWALGGTPPPNACACTSPSTWSSCTATQPASLVFQNFVSLPLLPGALPSCTLFCLSWQLSSSAARGGSGQALEAVSQRVACWGQGRSRQGGLAEPQKKGRENAATLRSPATELGRPAMQPACPGPALRCCAAAEGAPARSHLRSKDGQTPPRVTWAHSVHSRTMGVSGDEKHLAEHRGGLGQRAECSLGRGPG